MTDNKLKGNQGYLYTLSIIILMMMLILLIMFYTGTMRTKVDDLSGGIRCDELYYFVQDVEYDLERAMLIFGRRAAIYAIDDVVTNNRTMYNYTYRNCTEYVFEGNGSEAAIAELVMCGTLYGQNVTYMLNHTLPIWLDRIGVDAEEMRYELNVSVLEITVTPYDAWDFALILTMNMQVQDRSGLCYYSGSNVTAISITDIIGLEDPLYPIHTNNKVSKYIYDCDTNISIDNLAGCSTENWGEGTGSGNIVFYSNIKDDPGLGNYCSQTSGINDIILVFDLAFGNCQGLEYNCFDITHEDHLAGVIDYAKNNPDSSFVDKCNVTVPWISATGKIDNETQQGQGHQRDPDCADGDVSTGLCAVIKNIPDCEIHQVLIGYSSEDVNTTCYVISNVTQYWGSCPGEEYPNGPSFFDRLDGRLNLSERYVNQSLEYFNNEYIGIETLVSLYDLANHGVTPNTDPTWVDYLYWANKSGYAVGGICPSGAYDFKLDCQHAYSYSLDTSQVNASGVPPVSDVSGPDNDSAFPGCPAVYINGTADDCDGSVVSVEVGINGVWYNTTWDGIWWNYTFVPQETDMYVIASRAVDDDGLIEVPSRSNVISVTDCASGDNTTPGAPSLEGPPSGTITTTLKPTLYWSAVSDASGIYRYQIQLNQTSNPQSSNTYYSWDTEYTPPSNLNKKDYAWKVRAQDGSGNWGDWSETWTFTADD
jgi:hypothetical protein